MKIRIVKDRTRTFLWNLGSLRIILPWDYGTSSWTRTDILKEARLEANWTTIILNTMVNCGEQTRNNLKYLIRKELNGYKNKNSL